MLRTGVSTACLYPMPVEDALYELALGGVQQVEIFLNTHSELRRSFIMNLAALLGRFGISCRSLHPFTCEMEPLLLFSQYERRTADAIDYYKHYFSAMQALGADVFVLHGNKVTGNNELYFERFAKLADIGREFGVTVAQENVSRCTSRSLDFLRDM
ncbi:MAG: sugar phosphate isomerase/epimerase family protein, partial [Ruminococcus sp.]